MYTICVTPVNYRIFSSLFYGNITKSKIFSMHGKGHNHGKIDDKCGLSCNELFITHIVTIFSICQHSYRDKNR